MDIAFAVVVTIACISGVLALAAYIADKLERKMIERERAKKCRAYINDF